jgi:hypothetical protein
MKLALISPNGKIQRVKWIKERTESGTGFYLRIGKSANKITVKDLENHCDTGGHIETTDKKFLVDKILGRNNVHHLEIIEVPIIVDDAEIEIDVEINPPQKISPVKVDALKVTKTEKEKVPTLTEKQQNNIKKKIYFRELSKKVLFKLGRTDNKHLATLLFAENSTVSRYINERNTVNVGFYYIQSLEILDFLQSVELHGWYIKAENKKALLSKKEFIKTFNQVKDTYGCTTAFLGKMLGYKRLIYDILNGDKAVPKYLCIPIQILASDKSSKHKMKLAGILISNAESFGESFKG